MAPKTDTVRHARTKPTEPVDNPLVHIDDGPYSEGADGKSGVHPGWWAAAFGISGIAWTVFLLWRRIP